MNQLRTRRPRQHLQPKALAPKDLDAPVVHVPRRPNEWAIGFGIAIGGGIAAFLFAVFKYASG